ncbi:unnamed protein product [Arctia plantaginis]|uniref:H15 domain-containing protein n=1 Tax=Arctia plantaginis TaxID=874455 RepID=A0A8S0ZSA0_ARCPL|nr:unnamed protein product [Arctia plantaginis]
MSSEGSDIELQSALPKKTTKKMPKSPSEDLLKKKQVKKNIETQKEDTKKLSTKFMIHQALIDLKSRKGVSLQAIKKYLTEKYNVDTEKINYIIKKYIKKAVEEGTIIQTKGIGASGSFKLVALKEKKAKPKKKKEEKEGNEKAKKTDKTKKMKETSKKSLEKAVKSKTKQKEGKSEDKPKKIKKVMMKEKVPTDKQVEKGTEKTKKTKITKAMQTPAKKRAAMLKRKSIGSIIKPPKMKPKAKT